MFEPFRLKGKCLYTPKGAAREYAAVGCNFHRGCPFQCTYCYNRKGLTAKVLGLPEAVLEEKFSNSSRRPKKYRDLTGEDYAFSVFQQEVSRHANYLRDTGIFFSFSTDPLCPSAFDLTIRAVSYALSLDIPVKVLTKSPLVSYFVFVHHWIDAEPSLLEYCHPRETYIPRDRRSLFAIGFTLTGRDDQEPFACSNEDRISLMRAVKDLGFRTFASIEPIVDFDSSLLMIRQTLGFCDQYLIGLMSKRSRDLPPYTLESCASFVFYADQAVYSAILNGRCDPSVRIYWKNSVRHYVLSDAFSRQTILHSPVSVNRDWSLFTPKNTLL